MLRTCLIASMLLAACAVDPAAQDEQAAAGGKADGASTTVRLVQGGMFRDDLSGPIGYVPKLVHVGFVSQKGPDWQDVRDIHVDYQNHANMPVTIDVTGHEHDLLAFVIYEESNYYGYKKWSNANAYIDLGKHREGSLATFAVSNTGGYPFSNACYWIGVANTQFPGRISNLWYAFTKATQQDYNASNDVAWLDSSDNTQAEGTIPVTTQHDGDYKGEYVLLPEYVWVPNGENVVFKLAFDKWTNQDLGGYGGYGYCGGDQIFLGHAETQTYFQAIP